MNDMVFTWDCGGTNLWWPQSPYSSSRGANLSQVEKKHLYSSERWRDAVNGSKLLTFLRYLSSITGNPRMPRSYSEDQNVVHTNSFKSHKPNICWKKEVIDTKSQRSICQAVGSANWLQRALQKIKSIARGFELRSLLKYYKALYSIPCKYVPLSTAWRPIQHLDLPKFR